MTNNPEKAIYYHPLGEEDFDKEHFLKGFSKVSGLENILKILKEDPNNAKAIGEAGKILKHDEQIYFKMNNIANTRQDVEDALPSGYKGIEKYIGHNEEKFLSLIPEESYVDLLKSVRLTKKKDDEKHNELVEAQENLIKFQEAAQDESKMYKFLEGRMKNAPDWVKKEFLRMGSNTEYIQSTAQAYGGFYSHRFNSLVEEADHKKIFKDSLEASEKKGQYYQAIAKVVSKVLSE